MIVDRGTLAEYERGLGEGGGRWMERTEEMTGHRWKIRGRAYTISIFPEDGLGSIGYPVVHWSTEVS